MTTTQARRPRLRALSLGEIVDVAIKLCVAHWRTLLAAVLVVIVPVQVLSTIVLADYTLSSPDFDADSARTPEEALEQLDGYLGGLAATALLQVCAVALATGACFRAIAQAYLGEAPDWRGSLSHALRHAPSLVWITLLYLAGVVAGALLLVVPGVWLYVAWAFALPVLLVEGLRGPAALGRSFALVRGRWWRTFGAVLVGFLLAAAVSMVVRSILLVGVEAGEDSDVLVLALTALGGILGLALGTPLQAAVLAVVYFDLRVRKEGFDLEQLAHGLDADPPPAVPGAPAPEPAPAPAVPFAEPTRQAEPGAAALAPPPPGWGPASVNGDGPDRHEPPC